MPEKGIKSTNSHKRGPIKKPTAKTHLHTNKRAWDMQRKTPDLVSELLQPDLQSAAEAKC